jgi:hypothetical protein
MHTGEVRGKETNKGPPKQIFKKVVNKMAIKPKIEDPLAILSEKH